MAREPNLGIEVVPSKQGGGLAARVHVRYAQGYTRDGAPTLTPDCETPEALERAASLLVDDLNAAVKEAEARLAGREPEPIAERPARPAEAMAERKIGCLPVTDASGLVGIVTESDFIDLLVG